jgi:prepilin-type N-terminal cleavage/methylation domain-containing protein/prepilin-type processing-associated H-X9-DG protein
VRTVYLRHLRAPSRAFTLIEVLVVVAIIALLIAILLPSLARVRFQAKLAVCKANMHDLGSSVVMYASAFKGYYPLTAGSGDDNFFSLWKARMLPNVKVLLCPNTQHVIRPETLKWPVTYKTSHEGAKVPQFTSPDGSQTGDISAAANGREDSSGGHSYEYQGCYEKTGKNWSNAGKHRRDSHYAGYQSKLAIVFDADPSMDNIMGTAAAEGCVPSKQNNGNNCPQPWDNHGAEGVNVLYMDGHADFARKVHGKWNDVTALSPGDPLTPSYKESKSAVIDQIFAMTQYPWNYCRKN